MVDRASQLIGATDEANLRLFSDSENSLAA